VADTPGYTPQTVKNMLADLGRVGRWMAGEGLVVAQLDEDAMAAFRAAWQGAGHRRALGPRAMVPTPGSPLEALVAEHRMWLVRDRGLVAATVLRYENTVRRFLRQQAMADDVLDLAGLAGADVSAMSAGGV
jgi:hypothetical protein